jgi:hypothetical protein
MTGKNFSCNNMGQRKKSDFYETPYSITQQFLDREKLNGSILEPASGSGAISKILIKNGYEVISKDLSLGDDFLKESNKFDTIITNPPFSLAFEFIQKAKEISDYFAFLLPLSYLHGKKRFDNIYSDEKFPLSRIYVFTRYPMLGEPLRKDGKYNTGMMVYAWFVWDKFSVGREPIIRWIDNNHNVLTKEDK